MFPLAFWLTNKSSLLVPILEFMVNSSTAVCFNANEIIYTCIIYLALRVSLTIHDCMRV